MDSTQVKIYSVLAGFALLFVLYLVVSFATGCWNVFAIAEGTDKRISTSKLQFVLWTILILFIYFSLWVAKGLAMKNWDPIEDIPANVLIALGLSIGTATLSKAITVGYIEAGKVAKTDDPNAGLKAVVADDGGFPDLSKIQMLCWTVVAMVVYTVAFANYLHTIALQIEYLPALQKTLVAAPIVKLDPKLIALPDIGGALMVLMGLGQGAYLGKKLTSATSPTISGISPAVAKPGDKVTITGLGFGDGPGNYVTFDSAPVNTLPENWSDTKISITVPVAPPLGGSWPGSGQKVDVAIVANGQTSANTVALSVSPDPATLQPVVTNPLRGPELPNSLLLYE